MSSISIFDLSLSLQIALSAHSLSNIGSNGTNRLIGRKVLLVDGIEADAISGGINKRGHRGTVREYFQYEQQPLCSACAVGDGRGAAGLSVVELRAGHPVARCAVCDVHGYMVVGRGDAGEREFEDSTSADPQTRQARPSLIQFSFAIGIPEKQAETRQLFTRAGHGQNGSQMLMTMPNRSGVYALNVRYRAIGIGTDTYSWPGPSHLNLHHRAESEGFTYKTGGSLLGRPALERP